MGKWTAGEHLTNAGAQLQMHHCKLAIQLRRLHLFCSKQVTDNKTGTILPHKSHSGSVFISGDAKCDSNEDGVEDDSTLESDRGSGVPQTLQLSLLGVIRNIQGR